MSTSTENTRIAGTGVGRGSGVGTVVHAHDRVPADRGARHEDADESERRLLHAVEAVVSELDASASASEGDLAEVLGATAMIARDPALLDAARSAIARGATASAAFDDAVQEFSTVLRAAGGYLAERVTDLVSVRDRVVARLLGAPYPGVPTLERDSVVISRDLAPADLADADLSLVRGIVLTEGGPTSHTALVAAQKGIPCLVAASGALSVPVGTAAVVDAARGVLVPDPDARTLAEVAERAATTRRLEEDRAPGATADGVAVQLLANIGTPDDARALRDSAVEGVGLFRTELLFLDRDDAPSLEEQADTYAAVLGALGGRKVVVRTMDAGADKPLAFANTVPEENPALGVRGFRLHRRVPDLLVTQVRALAVAAERTGVEPWVMAPMVSTPAEAARFAALATQEGLRMAGAMVEVPAAALRADRFIEPLGFVSLGTNDLAQYVMAADRLNPELADLLDAWQPAVLALVAATAAAGSAADTPVGVCGESAADPAMALVLVGLGVTSLSMAPAAAPAVRHALRRHTLAQCREMASAALDAQDAAQARIAVTALIDEGVRTVLGL